MQEATLRLPPSPPACGGSRCCWDWPAAEGDFTAPFDGTHGWYFRNKGDTPVTVTVKTVGFYKDLFQPKGE